MSGSGRDEAGIHQLRDGPLEIHEIHIVPLQHKIINLCLRQRKRDSVEHIEYEYFIVKS